MTIQSLSLLVDMGEFLNGLVSGVINNQVYDKGGDSNA